FASRLGPGQSRPLTDSSPGAARPPGRRAVRATEVRRGHPYTRSLSNQTPVVSSLSSASVNEYLGAAIPFFSPRQRPKVRILSGAPLPNKTGHSGRTAAAGGNEPFQDALAAPDADFVVVDLDLVDDRADVGAAEGCVAGQDV